jgi:hypothetical protein
MPPPSKKADCRFCLEPDLVRNLVSPCVCKGSAKYIHNDCLLKWYLREPERGRYCNTCLEEYTITVSHSLESIPKLNHYATIHLDKPFIIILLNHWLFFTCTHGLNIVYYIPFTYLYIIFQTAMHILYAMYFDHIGSRVKNRDLYKMEWLKGPRSYLPFVHVYLILTIPTLTWISGIASNICACFYFYEHLKIIKIINEEYKITFVSRP